MDSLPLPGELMVDIFLRLPDPADLVRASAACVSFRRHVADRSFLRQYRKIHAPPLLGFLDRHKNFQPAVKPHPSAPAANAVALAADFSFSFLPAPVGKWVLQDNRDGRVLLDRTSGNADGGLFTEIVVCDPLYRLFLILPPIPVDLAATVEHPRRRTYGRFCETFLIPPAGNEAAAPEETSFRVMWVVQCKAKLVASVFSSKTGQWRAVPSRSWNSLFAGLVSSPSYFRRHAYDCIYWMLHTEEGKKMLVFDTQRMEFSIAEISIEAKNTFSRGITIAETREGTLGMFVLADGSSELELSYSIMQHDGESSSRWKKEKIISLGHGYILTGSMGRYLFLCNQSGFYTLDAKTFQLDKLRDGEPDIVQRHGYSNFPPSLLSSPRISSDVEERGEEVLEHSRAESPRPSEYC